MRLIKSGGAYVAESSFDERLVPKAAGFWWHGGGCRAGCQACAAGLGKVWWTPDKVKAARLIQYADEAAGVDLRAVPEAQAASKAVDAEISAPSPAGLAYLPYQRAGIAYSLNHQSVLLADDMGLGKTIQALGVINADPSVRNVLVIAPSVCLRNWEREARKWLTRPFQIRVITGRELPDAADQMVVVNYDKLIGTRGAALVENLLSRSWDVLICDEAHVLKNGKAQRTKIVLGHKPKGEDAVQGLIHRATRRLILTGTPILNRPVEAYGLLNSLCPGQFGTFFGYAKRYCAAQHNGFGWDFSGASNLDELQEKMRALCMVRRLKKDVLKELPDRVRQLVVLPSEGCEKAIRAEREAWAKQEGRLADLRDEIDLAHASGDDASYKAAVAALQKAHAVAFSEISRVRHETALAKVPAVIEHVRNALESTDKLIVFAHHHDVEDLLMEAFGDMAVLVTGETPFEKKDQNVQKFQGDPACRVFVGGIKAAGVAITLTAASTVIFAEQDWTPSGMDQAESRAHRMGQRESVLIQYLVLDGSLDARMAELLVEKATVIDAALDDPYEREIPALPSGGKIARPSKYPPVTDAQRVAALQALRIISGMCDGAHERDGVGFNGCDTKIGKTLAALKTLSDGQVFLAKRILPKYHGQIGEDLLREVTL
jgi:SWI/SNF-related matrix-associated actin-dependent regulator 1 of chromatin subfamily A